MRQRWIDGRTAGLAALGLALLVVAATACSSDNNTPAASSSDTTTSSASGSPSEDGDGGTIQIGNDQANDHGEADATGQDELKVEQDNFYFKATVVTGTAGQALTLEVENEGSVQHTFTIDDQSIDVSVDPGESSKIDVTFPDSGMVEFYCRFHRSSGMVGGLKVA
jgi:plastocyanin